MAYLTTEQQSAKTYEIKNKFIDQQITESIFTDLIQKYPAYIFWGIDT